MGDGRGGLEKFKDRLGVRKEDEEFKSNFLWMCPIRQGVVKEANSSQLHLSTTQLALKSLLRFPILLFASITVPLSQTLDLMIYIQVSLRSGSPLGQQCSQRQLWFAPLLSWPDCWGQDWAVGTPMSHFLSLPHLFL